MRKKGGGSKGVREDEMIREGGKGKGTKGEFSEGIASTY